MPRRATCSPASTPASTRPSSKRRRPPSVCRRPTCARPRRTWRRSGSGCRPTSRRAQVAFENAEAKRKVLPDLVAKGFITRDTLEDAELRAIEAKIALQAAQFNLQRVMAGATPAELERAQVRLEQATFALNKAKAGMESQLESYQAGVEREKANVERAKTLIETAETRLKVKEITAPKDGLVVYAKASDNKGNEKIQLGMIPYEGQPILYLPDPSTIVADTEVNEVDIAKVRVGGPVELELDSFPGVVFHGTVLKIGSLARMKLTPAGTPSRAPPQRALGAALHRARAQDGPCGPGGGWGPARGAPGRPRPEQRAPGDRGSGAPRRRARARASPAARGRLRC
ncbi:MAG: HlyD family efflux transporter periplasmic adaptor subunit [Deltaproteobacteria bacterium]|nr:MAG: HlyD family efflux transporter periplasmic adaptor subunit [Deltaproteobacteria bacterium]